MTGISSKVLSSTIVESEIKFNGIEFENDLDLLFYDAFFRELDPQISVWRQIDPKIEMNMENWGTYISNFNNPILYKDPKGDCPTCNEIWKDIKSAAKETVVSTYNGAVSIAREINQFNPLASLVEVVSGKSSASDFVQPKPRSIAVADLGVNVLMLATGEVMAPGRVAAPTAGATQLETEIVQRAMSKAELNATSKTGLLRGGRSGTHYVSDAIGNDAKRVQQRLSLSKKPEVKVSLEVPKGKFSNPTKVDPKFNMPGGGKERTANGEIPVKIINVWEY